MRVTTPTRATHTYTQHLTAPPEVVFPLLCPVREVEWAHDWEPTVVYSESGVAEQDCVFVTPGAAGDEVWVVTDHDAEAWAVEMVMVAPTVVATRLTIQLRPSAAGCLAEICYRKTSLGPAGDDEVARFTDAAWESFMSTWETEVNEHLRTVRRWREVTTMTRFLYDLRTPRQRGVVADERAATHRAELERAARERRAAQPAAPLSRWACGLIRGRRQAGDVNGQIAALEHRVEHLERHLRALSQRG